METTAAMRPAEPAGADAIGISFGRTRSVVGAAPEQGEWVGGYTAGICEPMQEDPEMAMGVPTRIASPTIARDCFAGRVMAIPGSGGAVMMHQ